MYTFDDYFSQRSKRDKPKRQRRVEIDHPLPLTTGGGSAWRHTRTGFRDDLGIVLRSGWEANVARVMNAYDIKYHFEPHTFTYPIKRGTRGYTPDFYLPVTGEWIEVKGYFDDKSRIKIKRFKKYYPEEFAGLTMIIGNAKAAIRICEELEVPYFFYPDLAKAYKNIITNWE